MRVQDQLLLRLADLLVIASALDPIITAAIPLASVTASVLNGAKITSFFGHVFAAA